MVSIIAIMCIVFIIFQVGKMYGKEEQLQKVQKLIDKLIEKRGE